MSRKQTGPFSGTMGTIYLCGKRDGPLVGALNSRHTPYSLKIIGNGVSRSLALVCLICRNSLTSPGGVLLILRLCITCLCLFFFLSSSICQSTWGRYLVPAKYKLNEAFPFLGKKSWVLKTMFVFQWKNYDASHDLTFS